MDLEGAIDLHVHTAPDVYQRSVDDDQQVSEASGAGMRGVLLKSHHTLTADRAELARNRFKVEVFGGLVLNWTVGGLNPVAVETAIAFGARMIWMPTIHAAHCLAVAQPEMFRAEARKGRQGITVLDREGGLASGVGPVLELIRDAGIALSTGHLAPEESLVLLAAARDMGIRRLVVTHPLMSFTRFTPEQMKAAVDMDAFLELDYLSCSPGWHDAVPPGRTAGAIRTAGPGHCVLATDGGQTFNPHPVVMLQRFAASLRSEGIAPEDLRTMMCRNPALILGL